VLFGQLYVESLEIGDQMLDLSAPNEWEHKSGLVQQVRNRHCTRS
jgi:hypothetical protein